MSTDTVIQAVYLFVTATLIPIGKRLWDLWNEQRDKIEALHLAHAKELVALNQQAFEREAALIAKHDQERTELIGRYESLLATQREEATIYAREQVEMLKQRNEEDKRDGREVINALVLNTTALENLTEAFDFQRQLSDLKQS